MIVRKGFALALLIALGVNPEALSGQPTGILAKVSPAHPISGELLAPSSPRSSPTLFGLLPADRTGLDFVYKWNEAPRYARLFNSSTVGSGVAVGDYDGDSLPDLCFTRPSGGYRVYRNLGDCRFTNVTEAAGLRIEQVWSTGVSFADVNGDGLLDLYVCCYEGANRLYINQGNGRFSEQAQAYGLDFRGASIMMGFADYDRDGDLDAYLLTAGLIPNAAQRFRVKFVNGRPEVPEELQEYWQMFYLPDEKAAAAEAGQFDHLFRNNGNGRFEDVSKEAGISGCDFGNAVLWWDYNQDGWPDLYVANDYFGPDHLYRNNQNGTFTDVTRQSLPHTPWTSMGADAGDLNNDGLIDLIASDMSGTTHFKRMIDMIDTLKSGWFLDWAEPRQYMRNAVFYNTGKERFLEAAFLTGLADTDWTWSILLGDLDNDGRLDVFIPNGMTRDWMDSDLAMQARNLGSDEFVRFWRAQPKRADVNLAFQNLGDFQFKSVGPAWGLDRAGPSFGAALADLDQDGDLDLVVSDFEGPVRLHRNGSTNEHRIVVQLAGAGSNKFGLGATVRIETAAARQMRYITLSRGFMSAGEARAQFGLGQEERINRLVIEWPRGTVSQFDDLPADRLYTVTEPEDAAGTFRTPPAPSPWFGRSESFAGSRIAELPFDDWAREPLLPWSLSRLGPGLAWGDVDGDGREDLYVSGSISNSGRLYLNRGQGKFHQASRPVTLTAHKEMAPLFFDANGDGSLDLFIVSGGVESEPGSEQLRDELWLNNGSGQFTSAPEGTLPDFGDSGSSAVAADYDRDGDLDLFIGGRAIPGKYPLTPCSRLLRNEKGTFTEEVEAAAPGLRRAGLVTSAVWSDADNDGWVDLFVCCEWGPVRFFHNEQGRLIERTREAGLSEHLGWWNGIAAGDVDEDGDIDYVVSNLGLNTRYQPSPAEPFALYYADFAGNGGMQLVEAQLTRAGILPLRGKHALEKVIPAITARLPTHHQYAAATLPEILGPQALESAQKVIANCAESGLLRNNGRGLFTFEPLQRLAQIAPGHGLALVDVDADGHLDLLLAQNTYGMHRETGRADGGVGLLLKGNGKGDFVPVWPNQSGIVLAADARSLATCDFNEDGWVDFVVGISDGSLIAFENSVPKTNRVLTLKLKGQSGNPTAVGARVTVHERNGRQQTAEVYAGCGYLSQSESTLRFGLASDGDIERVIVRWPDGKSTTHRVKALQTPVVLHQVSSRPD